MGCWFGLQLRRIRLKGVYGDDHDEEEAVGEEWDSLFGRTANSEAASARVFVDDFGTMHWPVLFMYPEYGQTDLISQANETTRYGWLLGANVSYSSPLYLFSMGSCNIVCFHFSQLW